MYNEALKCMVFGKFPESILWIFRYRNSVRYYFLELQYFYQYFCAFWMPEYFVLPVIVLRATIVLS